MLDRSPQFGTEDKSRASSSIHAEVIVHGDDCVEAEEAARTAAESSGGSMRYISPYNDVHVAGGQGTLAYEMLMQTRGSVDVVRMCKDPLFIHAGDVCKLRLHAHTKTRKLTSCGYMCTSEQALWQASPPSATSVIVLCCC